MTKARRAAAWAVLGSVVLGHAVCFALDEEAWPFLLYPMFSRPPRAGEGSGVFVQGQDAEGRPFLFKAPHSWPLFRSRLAARLATLAKSPDAEARLDEAFVELAALYERNRSRHAGPRLTQLRIVSCRWSTAPEALHEPWPDACRVLREYAVPAVAP